MLAVSLNANTLEEPLIPGSEVANVSLCSPYDKV